MDASALSNETESMIYGYINDTLWMKRSVKSALQEVSNKIPTFFPMNTGENSTLPDFSEFTQSDLVKLWLEKVEIPAELKDEVS